jgi:hypothetical protein
MSTNLWACLKLKGDTINGTDFKTKSWGERKEIVVVHTGVCVWMQFADFEVIICWVFVYAAILEK